jgi:hypothetical protein
MVSQCPCDLEIEGELEGLLGKSPQVADVDSFRSGFWNAYLSGYECGAADRGRFLRQGRSVADIQKCAEIRATAYLNGFIEGVTGRPVPETWDEAERQTRTRH